MTWFYLALLAPLLYAIVNLVDDNLLRNVYRSPHIGAIISGLFGGLPLLSLLVRNSGVISEANIFLAATAGFLTVGFLYSYFISLDRESPSVVAAVTGSSPVVLGVLAYIFLDEPFTVSKIIGLTLVILASLVLVTSFKEKTHFSKSLAPMLSGAALICVISLLLKQVYDSVAFYPAYMCFSAGMLIGGFYFMLVLYHSERREMLRDLRLSLRRYFWLFLAVEALGLAADFTMNLAISKGPVTTIRTMESIQPAYVLLIALIMYPFKPHLFREAAEGGLLKKFVCIALIALGLYLVQSGSNVTQLFS